MHISSPGCTFKKSGKLLNISNNTKEMQESYINLGRIYNYSAIDFDLFNQKNRLSLASGILSISKEEKFNISDTQMDKILKMIELVRDLDRESKSQELPIQVLSLFLYVASRNNCNKQDAENHLKMSKASTSSNSDWLSRTHYNGRKGLNLIRKVLDPLDKRKSLFRLTRQGRDLVEKMTSILYD